MSDRRVNPSYKTGDVILPVLLGFFLRIKSFNELNYMLRDNEFSKLIPRGKRLPLIDTIRDTLKVIDLDKLAYINDYIVSIAIDNKVFSNGTIDGYVVAAMDGTKIFGSSKKKCDKCLTYEINDKRYNYHNAVVMSLIGNTVKLVLDYEMYNGRLDSHSKNEGELSVAKRLLTKVVCKHNGFLDIVAYDALACNSSFINHCINSGLDVVVRVKQNNNKSKRSIKCQVNKKEKSSSWYDGATLVEAYEEEFYMTNVEPKLRYAKFTKRTVDNKRSQILIVTSCLDMSLNSLYKIIKARWDIENSIFNNLKNNASMEHCFVHGGNGLEAILYLQFIASNLFQLFKLKRIRDTINNQRELVRQLFKGLYLLKYDKELLINSS